MRSFEEMESVFILPIEKIEIDTRNRDDIPAIFVGLQYLYSNMELRQQVMTLMRDQVTLDSDHDTGRPGMNWWRVLVLATMKKGLDYDYPRLQDISNNHSTLRLMLQHGIEDRYYYTERIIQKNVDLLPVAVLNQISNLLVQEGLAVARKRPWQLLRRPS